MHTLALSLALVVLAAPLAAQGPTKVTKDAPVSRPAAPAAAAAARANPDPDRAVAGTPMPTGWTARFDRANANAAAVKFVPMGGGYHVTAGPSGIYYNASDVGRGNYTVRATFAQTKASAHPEAYGLLFGGNDLQGPDQRYMYFLVRQDGKYTIKHRAGAEVHTLQEWTEHAAVKAMDAEGKATNALAVDVGASEVRFLVNGTQVASFPRAQVADSEGVVGLRVNHNLDVHVEGFKVAAQ